MNIIPFEGNNLPAFAKAKAGEGNIAAALALSFESISIKGKVFHIRNKSGKTLVTKPGSDEPAAALEVVILGVGPSADRYQNAKTWYAKQFEDGQQEYEKPDCYSNMGIVPEADSTNKQCATCADCPKNVWGSGKDGKGRECGDSKRLAVARPDDLDHPMLLNVPAASLKPLGQYFNWLLERGIENSYAVVTRVGFDYSVAHPALTFKAVGFLTVDPTTAAESDQVQIITGKKALPKHDLADAPPAGAQLPPPAEAPAQQAAAPADAPAAPAAPKAARTKPAAKPTPAPAGDDDLPTQPRVAVKVEGRAEAPAQPVVMDVDQGLDAAMDDLDFDD